MENLDLPVKKHWDKIGFRHHHGIAVPLFSLHSKNSSGIGEFLDLIPLFPFLKEIDFDILQLLPLNDTGGLPSPYSSLTANGLNPIHLSLQALPLKMLHPPYPAIANSNWVDYEKVTKLKMDFLRKYFIKTFKILSPSDEYQKFVHKYRAWLFDYAAYRGLEEDRDFYIFLQYLCFFQFSLVKQEAENQGIFLKGDIPIFISKDSADFLAHSDFFLPEKAAGAPPDSFSKKGQYWGFPIYDWQKKFRNLIDFWNTRLKTANDLYHLYRLDHLVGLFRVWGIEEGKEASTGAFLPQDESLWLPTGKKILTEFLKSCPLLPIAEDLGVVPENVKQTLLALGIPGTKVLRWEKDIFSFSPFSMTTVSTHDTDTLKGWALNHPDDFKNFCKNSGICLETGPLLEILALSHKTSSLFHINLLQEYLSFIPEYTNKNPLLERINDPANPLYPNWRFRFIPSVEELSSSKKLIDLIKNVRS